MGVQHVGRDKYDDYHTYICDVDGCASRVEFNINNMPSGWQRLEVYDSEGDQDSFKCSKYLCPKHHLV